MTHTGTRVRLALAIAFATVVIACGKTTETSTGLGAVVEGGSTFLVACNDGTGSTDCCPTIADAGTSCDGTTARCSTGCQNGMKGYLYCNDGRWTPGQGLFPCSAAVGSCPTIPPSSGSSCTPPWISTNVNAHCSWGED